MNAEIIKNFLGRNFLIRYSWWKVSNDETYYKINSSLRMDWVNAQFTQSSMSEINILLPFIIFFFTILLNLSFLLNSFIIYTFFIVGIFLFLFLLCRVASFYDKYIDEKYLELSRNKNS